MAIGIIPDVPMNPPMPPIEPVTRPQRSTVVLAAVATLLVVGVTFGMLISQGVMTPQPSRVIVVQANSDWQNVELFVEGANLKQPQEVTIDKLGGYSVPLFLWPGQYTVRVKYEGAELYRQDFDLTKPQPQILDLLATGATTRPSTNVAQ